METIAKNILQHANIQFNTIAKATSGFTNLVFFVDDKYVIKFSNNEQIKHKLNKEIAIYKSINSSFIPKHISSGIWQDYSYLIISKITGKSLYSIWHTLEDDERTNIIEQIAKILKWFNQSDCSFLDKSYKIIDWPNYWNNQLTQKISQLQIIGKNVSILQNIVARLDKIMSNNQYGFVYNDAHFDNFIYDKTNVYLIDFDRAQFCPIDYEMLIIKTMCENPSKFASEEDEDKIVDKHYSNIYPLLEQLYPKMFSHKFYKERIAIYQFNYMISQAIKTKNNAWIDEELLKLSKIFQ